MEKIIFITLAFLITIVASTEPTIALSCRGEHEYKSSDGTCKECEKCLRGQQPNGRCGYGSRDYNYACEECPEGHYSSHGGYNICVVCTPCKEWNSLYLAECTPKHDSICGSCIEGFYKQQRADGSLDDECSPCTSAPEGTSECVEDETFPLWKVFVICGSVIFVCVSIIVVLIVLLCRKPVDQRKSNNSDNYYDVTPMNASQSLGDSRSESSFIELDPVKPSFPSSHINEVDVPAKLEATRPFLPSHHPSNARYTTAECYSNMPTTQFCEGPLSNHNGQTPSNMPTIVFDEIHPSQLNTIAMTTQPHNNTIVMPPPNNRPSRRNRIELSSSSENLLENADRNSKIVEVRQTPEPFFEPDSFDTRSYTSEATRPHTVVKKS